MPTDTQQWAGTYLIEHQISLDTSRDGDRPDPEECKRSSGMANLAWTRLTEDAAESYGDLSAKISIAVDLLRCNATERAQEMLGAVMVDLRLLEAKAALEREEPEEDESRLATAA